MKKSMNIRTLLAALLVAVVTLQFAEAKENIGLVKKKNDGNRASATCAPASSAVDLDANNIRCLLHNGGDMWWDLVGSPRYEVPKVENAASKRHSSFAGSLWIGGIDQGGQMRVAGQTYRQTGNDFWPGPLTDGGAAVDDVICEKWDKHYSIRSEEIEAFLTAYQKFVDDGTPLDMSKFPNVRDWPTVGEDMDGNTVDLAPFVDIDGDLVYNPGLGDYPDIRPVTGASLPSQAVWWVINDKGDVHTETGGEPIGLEIQMLAFAYQTTDEVNDMTFYKYKVINRSTLALNQTFMGQWVDSDVGFFSDDYVGCSPGRGLGFAYNGDANDEGATGYGLEPPTFGVDFFQGPIADANDGVDNDKDGLIDETEVDCDGNTVNERIGMSYFVYYENDFSLRGNPENATHFYGYLRGFWKDGSRMVDNGKNGFPATAPGPVTDYMYPGDAGWCGGVANGWSEVMAGNQPFDRRFLQSAGPFTLQPGAVNDIIVGALWARASGNANLGSVCDLFEADSVAQLLFDNCFKQLEGPENPDVTIGEYDRELMINWENTDPASNNYQETYREADPLFVGVPDNIFEFEGYMVYQLKDNTVSANEITDSNRARLLAQCDVKNGVTSIVNRSVTNLGGIPVIVDEVMVQGADAGIFHSVNVKEDLFSTSTDRRLKNYTNYYFCVVAYAQNDTSRNGRNFIPGAKNFVAVKTIPHKVDFENMGTITNSSYSDGIKIKQVAGYGNGGKYVRITDESRDDIIASNSMSEIEYVANESPITLRIVDPKEVKDNEYRIEVPGKIFLSADTIGTDTTAANITVDSTFKEWILYMDDGSGGWTEVFASIFIDRYVGWVYESTRPTPMQGNERLIVGHGIAIGIGDGENGGDSTIDGVIGSEMTFADGTRQWLIGLPDEDSDPTWNWINSGEEAGDNIQSGHKSNFLYDKKEYFEGILGGVWAPFCMARRNTEGKEDISPGVKIGNVPPSELVHFDSMLNLNELPDVDLYLTPDTTKWSRCVVIETTPSQTLGSGAWPLTARWALPVDQNGTATATTLTAANQGMGYFPGYAIDINTGRRLNVMFSESSWDISNNGNDMVWNPTSNFVPVDRVGGRHYIYIHNSEYDGCAAIRNVLAVEDTVPIGGPTQSEGLYFEDAVKKVHKLQDVYQDMAWVGIPLLEFGYSFDNPQEMPTAVKIELRTQKKFRSRTGTTDYPVFEFSTSDYAAMIGDMATAQKSLLGQVQIVPNPYYAYSSYEGSQIQTIVKLTNLPQKVTIKIFTLNGTLIRTFNKDSDAADQQWDLKNQNGVPIASGTYIIHLDAGDIGEKILKFFAILPEIDLQAF